MLYHVSDVIQGVGRLLLDYCCVVYRCWCFRRVCIFFFQAEDGMRFLVRSRGLGDVYKGQSLAVGQALLSVAAVGLAAFIIGWGLARRVVRRARLGRSSSSFRRLLGRASRLVDALGLPVVGGSRVEISAVLSFHLTASRDAIE